MRKVRAALLCVVASAAILLHSCNADNPAYPRENLKATWIVDIHDGEALDERDYTVMTFSSSGLVNYEGVLTLDSSNYQWGENSLRYDIYCCDLSIYGTYSGLFGYLAEMETRQEYSFIVNEDSLMTLGVDVWSMGGAEAASPYSSMTMRKLPQSYAAADTLYGVWQFNTRNGEDFSGYRLQFQPEGVLTVSRRTGENSWEMMGDSTDYYSFYYDFMALTVYDNEEFGTSGKWDVKCFSIDSVSGRTGRMAIRSGGEEFMLSYISAN
ncbi:MAG TPA: hypothetical protein IAC04_02750 [Candidatus Coprenecus stercoravium]|uniref:Lipoprotein n=1 Tax=Candidatus Coprenecus stercoravium TaxID=2840735 RepID=A0A9D2GNQ4_9BACT|nr:hypothetical protein [Candidatus Coprenecus stercoravium]